MRTAAEYRSQPRFLDTVRRVEIAALLAMSIAVALQYPPHGIVAAFALLAVTLALVPERRSLTATREEARLELLNLLQADIFDLRTRYMSIRSRPLTLERSQALWEVRREVTVWLASSQNKLRIYPEFAGIYQVRRGHGGLIDELDRCLCALSEFRRLSTLSQRLQLPI